MLDLQNAPSQTVRWLTGYAALGPVFATPWAGTPLRDVHWVASNPSLVTALGLPASLMTDDAWLQVLAGNQAPQGSTPYASVYSGHQFGVWAGQLGDGRALNLGAIDTPQGRQELQLKGAGPTPYSRRGDGRAVLRSSIREFLASEAMHGLRIPTTRALALVGASTPVYRESQETAAVVTRVAPSFVRFGHFEHFANQDPEALRALADHLVTDHFPEFAHMQGPDRYTALLQEVTQRTAHLMAQWQAVGFCHGVMNTDNMSMLGLTLDYGPFQFMDGFNAQHICNHSDHQGRYAYIRQPQVAYWNLFCLGQALMPLIEFQEPTLAALETYKTSFPQALDQAMRHKLGLHTAHPNDRDLAETLLQHMQQDRVDYTVFWRRLSLAVRESDGLTHAFEPVRDLFMHREAFDDWLSQYRQRAQLESTPALQRGDAMLQCNPKYVLRNHLGEVAIRQAQQGDPTMVHDLLTVLQHPFDEHPAFEDWAALAPEWASSIEISCSS